MERSRVSGLETAIRSALDRSERSRAEVRARIYQSARQALEAGLKKQNVNDPETVAEQRHRLEATIHAIEQEERARLKAEVAVEPPVRAATPPPAPTTPRAPAAHQEPDLSVAGESRDLRPPADARASGDDAASLSFGVGRDHGRHQEPAPSSSLDDVRADRAEADDLSRLDEFSTKSPAAVETDDSYDEDGFAREPVNIRAEPVAKPRRRRGFLSRILIFVTILSSVGIGAWWVYSTGLLLTPAQRETGLPSPVPSASSEDYTGDQPADQPSDPQGAQPAGDAANQPKTIDPQRGFSSDWIEFFQPSDVSKIAAGPNATVDVIGASDGRAIHIVSRSSDVTGAASIEVPADLLRQMVGQTSTLAITVQSSSEKPIQFALTCAFDRLGDCARHRFTANPEKADLLFRVTLPNTVVANTPGKLFINSDIGGEGSGINLYAIRLLPGR